MSGVTAKQLADELEERLRSIGAPGTARAYINHEKPIGSDYNIVGTISSDIRDALGLAKANLNDSFAVTTLEILLSDDPQVRARNDFYANTLPLDRAAAEAIREQIAQLHIKDLPSL